MDERDPRTYAIIGAAMEVHRELGCGFLESVYQEALALEFTARKLPFVREVDVPIRYKSNLLKGCFRADFICFGQVIVELKALATLSGIEESQVLNYLKATGMEVALLLNFGAPSLTHRRLIPHSDWRISSSVKSVQSAEH